MQDKNLAMRLDNTIGSLILHPFLVKQTRTEG